MIQIPPALPEPSSTPRRPDVSNVQAVPSVLADKAGVNPGVVLNLPPPVLETPTDGLRPRDGTSQAGATQIDNQVAAPVVRYTPANAPEAGVRGGLNMEGLPERLVKLLRQLERLSGNADVPVLWPSSDQVRAARPESAFQNLRRALGQSMMFEMTRLQARLIPAATPSALQRQVGGVTVLAGTASDEAALIADNMVAEATLGGAVDFAEVSQAGASRANPVVQDELLPQVPPPATPAPATAAARRATEAESGSASDAKAGEAVKDQGVQIDPEDDGGALSVIARRAESLSPESQSIRDAVRLLLYGELRWQGDLTPVVFARIEREDMWEEEPHSPGALVKGTLVNVEVDLPALGRVKLRGVFIRDSVRVTILPSESARGVMENGLKELRQRLDTQGLEAAQVRLAERDND